MTKNIRLLEQKYLKAKIAYYEGNPFLSDVEFDALENLLKKQGSRVTEQVGSKRKDFDFAHPTKMLSLAKLQTEETSDGVDYKLLDFLKWYNKNSTKIGKNVELSATPKFDGSAINIIYEGTQLSTILTRGNGKSGKDITVKFKDFIPQSISSDLNLSPEDILEIRCEVVIDVNVFAKKYANKFANPRNYVAGVIGQDEVDYEKLSELTIIPLNFIVNGTHVDVKHFSSNEF